jgi:hypothetical protein
MSEIVIGIIAGSIVALISFMLGLFGNMWYGNYQENRQRKNEALKKHFSDLEEQYIKPASEFLANISNQEGRLTFYNIHSQYSVDAAQTSWPTSASDKNFDSFKAHFSTTADELLKLETQVKINNEKNKAFNAEVVASLEEKTGIPVRDYFKKAKLNVPFFYQSIITFIRLSYMEHMRIQTGDKEDDDLNFNFHEVIYSPSQQDNNAGLITLKDGRHIAVVNNKDEAETCKKALIEVAENIELVEKGQSLYTSAEALKDAVENLSHHLYLICEQYSKFGKLLKRKKGCPTCKLIF